MIKKLPSVTECLKWGHVDGPTSQDLFIIAQLCG